MNNQSSYHWSSLYTRFVSQFITGNIIIKLVKGKALRKQSLYGKIAVSVLLKLFISVNKRCHTTDSPLADDRDSIFKCKQQTNHDSFIAIIECSATHASYHEPNFTEIYYIGTQLNLRSNLWFLKNFYMLNDTFKWSIQK